MAPKDGSDDGNDLVDESYWSRKLLRLSTKVGPFSLVLLVLLLIVFVVPWPMEGDDEAGTRLSLPSRYFRARDLERAHALMEEGQADLAVSRWRTLLAESPDDLRLLRLLLDDASQHKPSVIHAFGGTEALGARLFRAGGTNQQDVLRVIRIEAGLGNWARLRQWSAALGSNKPPEVRRWLARACLEDGDISAFEGMWSAFGPDFAGVAEPVAWRLAADAIAMDGAAAAAAMSKLEALRASPDKGVLVRRLLRLVARAKGDRALERQIIEELSASSSERLGDWLDYLETLAGRGLRDEMMELAPRIEEARCPAEDVPDAVMRLIELGLTAAAKAVVEKAIKSYPTDITVAMLRPLPFMVTGEWNGCLEAALALRSQRPTAGVVDAASYFVEGCAFETLGNEQKANTAFFEMESTTIPRPENVLQFAVLVGRLSVRVTNAIPSQRVWRLIKALEKPMVGSSVYWRARSEAAGRVNQNVDMVLSAERATTLDPASGEAASALVQALMLAGGRHAEALALSSGLMGSGPVEARLRLQHAILLASGGKPDEGRRILATTKAAMIPRRLHDDLRYAWLEVHVGAGEWEQARKVVRQLAAEPMEPFMARRFNALAGAIPN